MSWSELKWAEMSWMSWNEFEWAEISWNELEMSWNELTWIEMNWNESDFWLDTCLIIRSDIRLGNIVCHTIKDNARAQLQTSPNLLAPPRREVWHVLPIRPTSVWSKTVWAQHVVFKMLPMWDPGCLIEGFQIVSGDFILPIIIILLAGLSTFRKNLRIIKCLRKIVLSQNM